jgi:uncharacterized membrane protein
VLHLLHPVFVHVTVAFLIVGGLIEAWGIAGRRDTAQRFGGALVLLGTVSLIPSIVAGFLAENSLTLSEAAGRAVDRHERLGLLTLGAFVPLVVVKAWGRGRPPERWRAAYLALLLAGVGLAATAAYFGGLMVYELGVGVAAP